MCEPAATERVMSTAPSRWTADIALEAQRRDVSGYRAAVRRRLRERLTAAAPRTDATPRELHDASFAELAWYALGEEAVDDHVDGSRRAAELVAADLRRVGPVRALARPWARPWLASALERATRQLHDETGEAPRLWLGTRIAALADERLEAALAGLQDIWPEAHRSIGLHCDHVVWLEGERYHSMTMPYAFGSILVRPRVDMTVGEYIEALLHESAHLEMYVRQSYDPMVRNPLAPCRSPLRSDARPVSLVLHAAVVLARMIEGHRRWSGCTNVAGELDRSSELERRHLASLRAALAELACTADFTDAGAMVFASLVDRWGAPCS